MVAVHKSGDGRFCCKSRFALALKNSKRSFRNSFLGAHLVEQRLGFLQVERVETFGELAVETGVEFIDENGGGPGVRLRKREKRKS